MWGSYCQADLGQGQILWGAEPPSHWSHPLSPEHCPSTPPHCWQAILGCTVPWGQSLRGGSSSVWMRLLVTCPTQSEALGLRGVGLRDRKSLLRAPGYFYRFPVTRPPAAAIPQSWGGWGEWGPCPLGGLWHPGRGVLEGGVNGKMIHFGDLCCRTAQESQAEFGWGCVGSFLRAGRVKAGWVHR